jgi:hypothetical protein
VDGGYYLENGVSLCAAHHLEAEATTLSVEELRRAAGINQIIVPPEFNGERIDKWGNAILPNGSRARGPLFDDPNVQKILQGQLGNFTHHFKYPKTLHFAFSPGIKNDDRTIENLETFVGQEIVISEKMDGENTTMYPDHIHARSLNSNHHPSQAWVKKFHASIRHDIPADWRICGENLYARHSLEYTKLESYFLGFSIWDATNTCLSWDDTLEWFTLLGITPVPVLYRGTFSQRMLESFAFHLDLERTEGFVVRLTNGFSYRQFPNSVAKWVRSNHVQTPQHWKSQAVIPNQTILTM